MKRLAVRLTSGPAFLVLGLLLGLVLGAIVQRQYDKVVYLEHVKVLQRLTRQVGVKCDHVVLDCTAAYVEHCGKLD